MQRFFAIQKLLSCQSLNQSFVILKDLFTKMWCLNVKF
jgi:hypothetical protein